MIAPYVVDRLAFACLLCIFYFASDFVLTNLGLQGGIDPTMAAWLPITFAVNSLNRTMGQPDLYPFIISPTTARKLDYIRDLVQGRQSS